MILEDFNYDLPENLIAQKPLTLRDQSRLMVLNRSTEEIIHTHFSRFPEYLSSGDLLILNNSRVIPARVWGRSRDREIEFLFLGETEPGVWKVLCRPAKHVREGEAVNFSPALQGTVIEVLDEGQRKIRFHSEKVADVLETIGYAPLPPYIKRKENRDRMRSIDLERYQTVYAARDGSIAAPTAGLHFTQSLLDSILAHGIHVEYLTHDVGLATFQPVRVEDIEDHRILPENFTITQKTAMAVNSAREDGRPVTAVGTTSVRALESSMRSDGIRAGTETTFLYIYPGYEFRSVDRLLTNFHLPKSTLLMLVSAFAGHNFIMNAYREAVRLGYRFYSYGDCMYII
ncbi:tRNA preQ1(34) S-adenosylmethionine ribosyltransferase-isomerase QueA [Acidobacteriota bacterium]